MNMMNPSSSEFELHDLDDPIPADLGEPLTYQVFIMPVSPPKVTKGGIILADISQEANEWHNCIGKIARLGPCAFQHPRFAELGFTDNMVPRVGDLVMYRSKTPIRFKFDNARILVVHDDWIYGRATPETFGRYNFYT